MTESIARSFQKLFGGQKALLAIVLVVLLMALFNLNPGTSTQFFTRFNLIDLTNSNSILIILAMGQTVVLIARGVDLSIGGVMSLSGIIAIQMINSDIPVPLAIVLCLLFGVIIGAVNAYFSVILGMEPFIITLGMGIFLTGVAQQVTDARPVSGTVPGFAKIANFKLLGGIPVLVVVMAVVVAIVYWLLRNTSYGRNVYALGGDYEVAKSSGINVVRTKALAYVICGATAALAGVMLSSQLNAGNSIFGDTTALYVVCAVVVGGTSIAGGIGGAIQSTIGVVLLGLLTNAFSMLRLDSLVQYLPQALLGLVIVVILWLDSYGRKRKRETV